MEIEAPLEQTGPLSPEQEAALTGKEQQAEGENLLAGKFKTQEELEKGYKELESKLGEQSVQKEETPEQAETEETPVGNSEVKEVYGEAVAQAMDGAGLNVETLQSEFDETGDLSDESYTALEQAGYSRSTVQAYLRGVQSITNEAQELADAQVSEVMDSVGGPDEYAQMMAFARTLPQADQDAFNAQVSTGDVRDAKLAVLDMHKRFTGEMGQEPSLLEGGSSDTQADVYRSHTQLVKDMQSKAYKSDPAERERVQQKLARSDIFKVG